MPRINGAVGAYEQPKNYGLGTNGRWSVLEWAGTRSQIQALVPAIEAAGGTWDIREGVAGGSDSLIAHFTTNPAITEVPIDSWELTPQVAEKDVLEAGNSFLDTITTDEKRIIRDAIQNPKPGQSPALVTPQAIDLYLLMLNGFRSVRVNVPVFRRTRTTSEINPVTASQAGVGSLYSSGTLRTSEDIPTFLGLPDTGVSARSGLYYGWLKLSCGVSGAADRRTRVETQYEFGLWPTLIYGSLL